MTMRARLKDSGDEVEVLEVTGDGYALVAPPGDRPAARLVPRSLLDPDPWWDPRFRSWTDGSLATG